MRTNSLKMETDNDQTQSVFHLTLKRLLSSLARDMFCICGYNTKEPGVSGTLETVFHII